MTDHGLFRTASEFLCRLSGSRGVASGGFAGELFHSPSSGFGQLVQCYLPQATDFLRLVEVWFNEAGGEGAKKKKKGENKLLVSSCS